MISEIGFHPQPPDNERRVMSPTTAAWIMGLGHDEPLVDPQRIGELNRFVDSLSTPTRFDDWETVQRFADTLGPADELYWRDLDLLRPCLGNEHACAVSAGNETDYAPLFYDAPEALAISRLTALEQDGGKVLSVVETGNNFDQSRYNLYVAQKIHHSIDNEVLSPDAKKATELLVGQDLIGSILQGKEYQEALERFQSAWPESLAEFRDDLLVASYLSDASAHSAYRIYRNARNGYREPAVRPADAQLTFLFTRHKDGKAEVDPQCGAITLTDDRCQLLLDVLPGVNRLRHLLTGEPSPYRREDVAFKAAVGRLVTELADYPKGLVDQIDSSGETRVFAQSDPAVGGLLKFRTKYFGHSTVMREEAYYLPGDGRVWSRAFVHSGWDYESVVFNYLYTSRTEFEHPDPEVTAMRLAIADHDSTQNGIVGRPLSLEQAWRVINQAENEIF
jgi:hypothetical protein